MDPSDKNCFIAADKGDVVDVTPDQATAPEGRRLVDRARVRGAVAADRCFSQGRAREGDARHERSVARRQGQKTSWGACESAALDVGWRRSAGQLFRVHCGFWHGGMATCRLRIPEAHTTCASADSWSWSVSPQDPLPFLDRCFTSAKRHWHVGVGDTSRRRTAPSSCKNIRGSSGFSVACTLGCFLTTCLCSPTANTKKRSKRLRAAARQHRKRSMRPLHCRSRCSLQSS